MISYALLLLLECVFQFHHIFHIATSLWLQHISLFICRYIEGLFYLLFSFALSSEFHRSFIFFFCFPFFGIVASMVSVITDRNCFRIVSGLPLWLLACSNASHLSFTSSLYSFLSPLFSKCICGFEYCFLFMRLPFDRPGFDSEPRHLHAHRARRM